MKKERRKWQLVGHIGVDSGLVWIGDPCYVIHKSATEEGHKKAYHSVGEDWIGFCRQVDNGEVIVFGSNDVNPTTRAAIGIAFHTLYGDGRYPVYAILTKDGKVEEIRVDFRGNK